MPLTSSAAEPGPTPHKAVSAHLCPAALGPSRPPLRSATRTLRARVHEHSRARTDGRRTKRLRAGKRNGRQAPHALRTGSVEGTKEAQPQLAHTVEARAVPCRAKPSYRRTASPPLHYSHRAAADVLRSSSGGSDGASCGSARAVTRRDPRSGLKISSRGFSVARSLGWRKKQA